MVNRRDEVFDRDKKKLDTLGYLLSVGFGEAVWAMTYGAALATISGGTK